LKRGKEDGATHVIVVCDTFKYDDYPVFVMPDQDVREVEAEYKDKNTGADINMQRVMEVYSLRMDIEEQLEETRAFNYD
jgi:hypothetical protein